jgi:outer membrane protein, multidrug efflux system
MLHRFLFAITLLTLGGCKILHQPAPVEAVNVPTRYVGAANGADTTSLGEQPFSRLFTDPNLVALVDTALGQNLDLKIALQRIQVARANFGISQGVLLPQVDAVVSVGLDRFSRYTVNGFGNFDPTPGSVENGTSLPTPTPDFFVGIRASWEADIWGKLRNRRRAAYNRVLASQEGRNLIVTALVADVARLYYTLLAADAEREIIRDNIDLQTRAVELVEVQKQAGRVTELAVQQFRAQLLNTRSLEGQVRQRIIEAENALNVLLGRYPQAIARGASIRAQSLPASVLAGLPAQLVSRRPDIRQAERELEAANVDVAVAQAEFLPSLNLTPYLGLNSFRPDLLLNPVSVVAGVLGSLAAPVFNRRLLKGNLLISEAQSREAYIAYQRAILTGVSEVVGSLRGLENYRAVADLKTEEVAVLRQAATTSDDLFAANYATYLEVITAQRNVLDAELALINTKQAQFTSLIDLYRALGGGWRYVN